MISDCSWFGLDYWSLTPQQQPGSYQFSKCSCRQNKGGSKAVSLVTGFRCSCTSGRDYIIYRNLFGVIFILFSTGSPCHISSDLKESQIT